jgi:hypothetical protein
MQTRVKIAWPDIVLYRIQAEFERELLAASDEDIMEAARDLGMNPAMKGSAAFAGLKYPVGARQLAEFFGIGAWGKDRICADECAELPTPMPAPIAISRRRKHPSEK